MSTYNLKTKNVNSKRLLKEITDFYDKILDEFSVLWDSDTHREAILEVMEEYLEELAAAGKITQSKVVCDSRNNTQQLKDAGIVNLHVYYKQEDCYNTTVLEYTIVDE